MKLSDRVKSAFLRMKQDQDESTMIEEKRSMIEGIEELEETTVKEVMVPRIDVQFIGEELTREELFTIIREEGFSRYPVYVDTIDNVVGVLYAKDLITIEQETPFEIRKHMRKPYFIPESKRLDELLREFKKRKVHIAIAIDEYGGVSGIVTMEDILEVIIGDIQDEFDDEEDEEIIEMSDGIYLCDARASIDDINERLELELPDDEAETLGGFVFLQFGRIPGNQEKVTYEDIDFVVQEIDGHKINSVKIVTKNR